MNNINDQWKLDFIELFKNKEKFDEATALKQLNLPSSLFKYKGINKYTLDGLDAGKIWLNNPDEFNDPYDSGFNVSFNSLLELSKMEKLQDLLKEYISRLQEEGKGDVVTILKDLFKEREENLIHSFNKEAKKHFHKVFCLSERKDSILMWSHYANNHKGVCIEYIIDENLWKGLLFRCLFPVIYENNLIDITPYIQSSDTWEKFISFLLPLFYKAEEWSYEKEWRFILSYGIQEHNLFNAPPVKAVYLGAKISDQDRDLVLDICKKNSFPAFTSHLRPNTFELFFKNIGGL